MTDIAILSFVISLTYLTLILFVIAGLLRWFDWTCGVGFKEDVWEKIHEEPLALAVYYGLRLVAVFYLGAAFI